MPKKFPLLELRRWLNLYESGKSEISIAKSAHCDVRTVKRGIDQARRERDLGLARADLLKEALHNHQADLLGVVQGILSALEVPPLNRSMPWKRPMDRVMLGPEDKVQWELLKEHLKRDKVWGVLDQWKKAVATHLEAKIDLMQKAAALLEGKTGYKLVDKPIAPPFLYSYNAVDLFRQAALYHALGIPDNTNLEQNIAVDLNHGEVKCRGSTLAKAPGAEGECRRNILDALRELKACGEPRNAAATYRVAEELTAKARRAVEEIFLLGLVPGQCRVCRRLGM